MAIYRIFFVYQLPAIWLDMPQIALQVDLKSFGDWLKNLLEIILVCDIVYDIITYHIILSNLYMEVSRNGGTPKSSIWDLDFPWNKPSMQGTSIYGNLHIMVPKQVSSVQNLCWLMIIVDYTIYPIHWYMGIIHYNHQSTIIPYNHQSTIIWGL